MCSDCIVAQRHPELTRKTFNPACLWCGARYWQQMPGLVDSAARAEKGRSHVLDVWAKQGHNVKELMTIGMESVVPYAPEERKRR